MREKQVSQRKNATFVLFEKLLMKYVVVHWFGLS